MVLVNPVTLLVPTSGRGLGIGDNTLNFSASKNLYRNQRHLGDFEAVTNFTPAYE